MLLLRDSALALSVVILVRGAGCSVVVSGSGFVCLLVCSEMLSHCVPLAGLELSMKTRLLSNSEIHLSLPLKLWDSKVCWDRSNLT